MRNTILIAFLLLGAATHNVECRASSDSDGECDIIDGGTKYHMTLTRAGMKDVFYINGEDCGGAHKTAKGNRFYAHIHVAAWPLGAGEMYTDDTGNQRAVTNDKINAYWDDHFGVTATPPSSYTRTGAPSLQTNCYAYAMGLSVWVNDPAFLYADDYENCSPKAGAIIPVPGHCIKVETICNNGEGFEQIASTKEKFRESAIYGILYYCPGGRGGQCMCKKP